MKNLPMPNWNVFVVSKQAMDELTGSWTQTLKQSPKQSTKGLHPSSSLSPASHDLSGYLNDIFGDGMNYLENSTPKPLQKPKESGRIDAMESFDEWLKFGMEQGWCGPPVCVHHDGLPTTQEEDELEWDDYCLFVIRPYADLQMKFDVEKNHSPSVWRQSGF